MKKTLLFLLAFYAFVFAQNAWINEIHYDNSGTDVNEFLEIVLDSTANDTLSNYEIMLYRDTGTIYGQKTLDDFQLGSKDSTFKIFYLVFPLNGIQNGDADGLCLAYKGKLVDGQFLSYEGTLTATEGPATGLTSTDIGVEEAGSPAGHSLQLGGTGIMYEHFAWEDPQPETPGAVNANQTIAKPPILPEPTNHVTNFEVSEVTHKSVTLTWTGSVGDQLPQKYLVMAKLAEAVFPEVRDSVVIANTQDWKNGYAVQNLYHKDGDNEYTFNGLLDGLEYHFIIYPYTNSGPDINYKTDAPVPMDSVVTAFLPITPIADVRQNLSSLKGTDVKITGIVTAVKDGKGFFMQDQALPWSGIYVYDFDMVDSVDLADSLIISGTVSEYDSLSELKSLMYFNKISKNVPLPMPYPVKTGDFSKEEYEGLLVKVTEAICVSLPNTNGNWGVDDSTGVCLIGDTLYKYIPELESIYNVTGIGYQRVRGNSINFRTIEPRFASDIFKITTAPVITHIGSSARVPAADADFLDTVMVTSKFEIDTVILKYSVNQGAAQSVTMNPAGNDSTYTAAIPASAYNDADAVQVWIFATNTNFDTTESEVYGFFAGQSNIGALLQLDDQKEMVYKGLYARTSGVATAANGVLSDEDLSVSIQDEAYGAIRVFKYDSVNFVMTPGHNYTVTGKLEQYNGLNEIVPDFLPGDIIDNGEGVMPEAFTVSIENLLNGAESFEGLLVRVENADKVASGGSWPGANNSANMTITDDGGTNELTMRIESSTGIGGNPEPVWPQHVTGIFAQYDYATPYEEGYQLLPRSMADFADAVGIADRMESALPKDFALHNAYPNPFNPSTTIGYDIPADIKNPTSVSLTIYNTLGQKIKTLKPQVTAGRHKIIWHGLSDQGIPAATGIYFVVFRAQDVQFTKKMILIK
ncbi:MAG: T9SS type A sorting domain-containing protein [Calditrichaceae bacterium]|nr:T9SS type A sorting domain-containing protein [Calditrichaceae bacterium]MBN2708286.1 T9SS type A sorting domain-containing protein [Calditrichaceae bacterium]RQV91928.1 MAG: T9SS C-terminal target domain-containing protein [Calditrichota bacterium]